MSSLLKPPCLPGIELSVPVEDCGPFAPAEYVRVLGAVPAAPDPLRMLSPQPAAPQQAKATAAIDILFIEDSQVCVEVGRPAPGKQTRAGLDPPWRGRVGAKRGSNAPVTERRPQEAVTTTKSTVWFQTKAHEPSTTTLGHDRDDIGKRIQPVAVSAALDHS
jgi:hypothetical protein